MPDCIIIGAQRSGTTSLHNWLMQHPDVWDNGEPLRETHFFDYPHHWEQGRQWYAAQFAGVGARQMICEKSPTYLDHPWCHERVREIAPDARLVCVLRDPVERAWSHYRKSVAKGFEPDTFAAALRLEEGRLSDELDEWGQGLWQERYYLSSHHVRCYLRRGRYAEHLARWLRVFPPGQLLVVKSEEMFRDPTTVYGQVCRFLGLSAFGPEWKLYQRLPGGPVPRREAKLLRAYFRSHNERLASLLGDDKWLWEAR